MTSVRDVAVAVIFVIHVVCLLTERERERERERETNFEDGELSYGQYCRTLTYAGETLR